LPSPNTKSCEPITIPALSDLPSEFLVSIIPRLSWHTFIDIHILLVPVCVPYFPWYIYMKIDVVSRKLCREA
jgi:hypothetical protein